jgi:hypothetical protein
MALLTAGFLFIAAGGCAKHAVVQSHNSIGSQFRSPTYTDCAVSA